MGRLAPTALEKLPVHRQFKAVALGRYPDKAACLSPFPDCEVRYKTYPVSMPNACREETVRKVSYEK